MKKINDISNLSTLITYHRYMFSKDQAEILFKNIAIPEYIALEEIKDSLENGKVYLKVISDNMKISISKASKIVTSLKEKGLVQWSHDGDGSEGMFLLLKVEERLWMNKKKY